MSLKVSLVCLAFACGGGEGNASSGVDPDLVVTGLTDDQATDLCTYLTSLADQPSREIDCGDGVIVTVGLDPADVDDAILGCKTALMNAPTECVATVGQYETCFEAGSAASDDEICDPESFPASCDPVLPCEPS